jgi:hypothetical protein
MLFRVSALTICHVAGGAHRVSPILKEAIDGGKINLTALVNTHQYVCLPALATTSNVLASRFEWLTLWISHWDHAGGNDQLVSDLGIDIPAPVDSQNRRLT